MRKYLLGLLAAIALPIAALAQGAGNVLPSVTGDTLVAIDSGTLASSASVDTLKAYIQGAFGNTTITGSLNVTGFATFGSVVTCSGTTTATCDGQRFTVSVTGLTTAAGGTTSAAMVVTNSAVAGATSQVLCNVNGYSGTGQPIVTAIVPGTSQVSVSVTNVAASDSLNATVPISCFVLGP